MAKIFWKNISKTIKLDLKNWISLIDKKEYLEVQVGTYAYNIYTTVDDFHAICKMKKMQERKFEYVFSSLTCIKCRGKTRLDWVENTVGVKISPQIPAQVVNVEFIRNPKGPIKLYGLGGDVAHLSSPRIITGHHLCGACLGTGLHKFNDALDQFLEYYPEGGKHWDQNVIDAPKTEQ